MWFTITNHTYIIGCLPASCLPNVTILIALNSLNTATLSKFLDVRIMIKLPTSKSCCSPHLTNFGADTLRLKTTNSLRPN